MAGQIRVSAREAIVQAAIATLGASPDASLSQIAEAAGVGRAAMEAFVASFLTIIVLNLLLAKLLNDIGYMFIVEEYTSPLG